MSQFAKVGVTNDSPHVRVIWIEPWGGDFTLLPGESIELHAVGPAGQSLWFHFNEHEQCTHVYVEGGDLMQNDYTVLQNGVELQPGHNRSAALAAGIRM